MGSAGKRLDMSEETIFTRIVDGEIPSYTVYEDEMQAVAEDIRDARQVMLRPIGPLVLSRFLLIT